jgi:hypothetical protein
VWPCSRLVVSSDSPEYFRVGNTESQTLALQVDRSRKWCQTAAQYSCGQFSTKLSALVGISDWRDVFAAQQQMKIESYNGIAIFFACLQAGHFHSYLRGNSLSLSLKTTKQHDKLHLYNISVIPPFRLPYHSIAPITEVVLLRLYNLSWQVLRKLRVSETLEWHMKWGHVCVKSKMSCNGRKRFTLAHSRRKLALLCITQPVPSTQPGSGRL